MQNLHDFLIIYGNYDFFKELAGCFFYYTKEHMAKDIQG